ncbi:hypothetical protein BSKO_05943 [Bryopsis sp. KO-2023]|nr:hypothetical protein BSKO_05943 [Bryopsis sp. KO-2023]
MAATCRATLFVLVLASVRLGAAESFIEYIKKCELLGKTAAVEVKKEACEVVVNLCGAPNPPASPFLPQTPPPRSPPAAPPSSLKNNIVGGVDMKDFCRVMIETDCPSEAMDEVFRQEDDCYLLEVYGPKNPAPGCENADAVEERLDREIDDRCNEVKPLEWIPPAAAF